MMLLGPLVLLLIIVVGAVAYAVTRAVNRRTAPGASAVTPPGAPGAVTSSSAVRSSAATATVPVPLRPDPQVDLAHWVAAGLLTTEQASAIEAYEQTQGWAVPAPMPVEPSRPRRVPVVAEALGYLGGALTTVGLALVVSRFWPDMGTAGRLVLSGLVATALAAGGWLVHEEADPSLARLRWVLWLASTAAAALFAGVLGADGMELGPEAVVMMCAGVVAVESAFLWHRRPRPLQQVTCLGGFAVFAGSLASLVGPDVALGLAVWIVGAAYVAFGLRRVPPLPLLTETLGALALVVGSMVVGGSSPTLGMPFWLLTGVVLLAIVLLRPLRLPGVELMGADLLILGVAGGWTVLQGGIGTMAYYSQDAGALVGIAAWLGGALLIVLAARKLVRVPLLVEAAGGVGMLIAAAITGAQSEGIAPLFGIATAIGLVVLGMRPGHVLLSVIGSIGLLANVPWAISYYFPGEGRVPLLIFVCGALILVIAVSMTRIKGDRFRGLGGPRAPRPPVGTMMPRPSH